MEFVTIDIETANPDMASICQIGIARFSNGHLVEQWRSFVQPEDYFDPVNVSIHKIDEAKTKDAPPFYAIADKIRSLLENRVVVSHTHFDRSSLRKAFEKGRLEDIPCRWLDSAMISRRAWPEFAQDGYRLPDMCQRLGYTFTHHDALEDAKACGHVVLAAIQKAGLDIEGWIARVNQPVIGSSRTSIVRKGSPDGALYGEVLVFTGELVIPRARAADLAAAAGCRVAPSVTGECTLLVLGDQEIPKLGGEGKSSKHRKVEQLITKGQNIRILSESDFLSLIDSG
jgi:DNA polymerase-3 subunit epsilon